MSLPLSEPRNRVKPSNVSVPPQPSCAVPAQFAPVFEVCRLTTTPVGLSM